MFDMLCFPSLPSSLILPQTNTQTFLILLERQESTLNLNQKAINSQPFHAPFLLNCIALPFLIHYIFISSDLFTSPSPTNLAFRRSKKLITFFLFCPSSNSLHTIIFTALWHKHNLLISYGHGNIDYDPVLWALIFMLTCSSPRNV